MPNFFSRIFKAMAKDYHETYSESEVKPPTDRSTGLVFAAVALIVAALWRNSSTVPWIALGVGLTFAAISVVFPVLLRPLNWVWFRFGLLLHRVMNPLILFAMFVFVFVPGGLIMRIWHDPLRSRRAADNASYWLERQGKSGSMKNQF